MPDPDRRSALRSLRKVFSLPRLRTRQTPRGPLRLADDDDELESAGELLGESFIRRLERLNLLTRGLVIQGLAGEHRSRRHASSTEFADFRQYVPGDDFRRIDWNAFARLDGLFLKQTEAKEDVTVHLLVDCSQSMNWGTPNKLGFARHLAAALGFLALARFDAVTAVCFADTLYERFPLVRGRGQTMRLLSYLDRAPVGGATRLQRAMDQYCSGPISGGIAFLISDLFSDDDWEAGIVRLLREGMDVVVIQVLAPQELNPTVDGDLELFDAETGDVVDIVVGDEARRTYEQRVQAWCASVATFCHRSEVGHLTLDTTVPLEEIFLNRMRLRRIVR
ncbi:MAG TPA: DUF58 domain-containing protein [Chloroflexota bacterium]|nr:DUF58 domain-containing protein [Chloroflexota bacterium]